ncbi:MAG TPA: hypothetical protein VGD79_08810 [Thermoanaerobaculia bacterium]|jgi:hypothetical protein
MNGIVQGGWEFVIAAYSITAIGLIAYTISVVARLREAKRHDR